jgi:Protein of unknown function, DUF547
MVIVMRFIISTILIFLCMTQVFAFDESYLDYDQILKRVIKESKLDPVALHADSLNIDVFLKSAAQVTLSDYRLWENNDRLAFLINVYNASILQLISQKYPITTIGDLTEEVGNPWEYKFISIFNDYVSLNDIESKMIFKWFDGPLAHFAISSISYSSPPFRAEHYNGKKIETQLEDQAKQFIAKRDHCNRYDKVENILYLSSMFKWFRKDFGVSDRDLITFIANYNKEVILENNPVIKYLPFDWNINFVK